jgi:SAM-dependent methyltransferases related to tRNA (uracil-5-)-methyltransferase
MKPEKVVYISCSSGILAKDLKYHSENEFEVKEILSVDSYVSYNQPYRSCSPVAVGRRLNG